MSWSRPESDPLKARRRQLAEQERLLAERMARLTDELDNGRGAPSAKKAPEPPVWRMEDEAPKRSSAEPVPRGRRVLARQRRRDKVIFIICIVLLSVLVLILACVWTSMHGAGAS